MKHLFLALLFTAAAAQAAVTATSGGNALATRDYPDDNDTAAAIPVVLTFAGEAGFNITATLDGANLPLGTTTVSTTGYHEVYETRTNTTTNVTTTVLAFQFIIASPGRKNTEMGLPISEPHRLVNDAPSAFAGGVLDIMAPAVYPLNLPVPVLARLKKGPSAGASEGDPLWLHGKVNAPAFPARPIQLRRGWGSTILPAATVAGTSAYDATVNGLSDMAAVTYEPATTWTAKTGNITTSETWPASSRTHFTGTLTIKPGATLTIESGAVVRCGPGAEVWIEPGGHCIINGTTATPVTFAPDSTAAPWGGFWLHQSATAATTARLTATGALFCCWGADQNWYTRSVTPVRTIFARHRQQQPFCATGTNATCSLTDCALIGPVTPGETRGVAFASQAGNLLLTRTLAQRAISGGEQKNGSVEIHSCAFVEFNEVSADPDDGTDFIDADNDGIYLVPEGTAVYHLSKTVIGWTKDDGIDSGGDNAGSTICNNCWFENCVHEAFSNSGGGRIPQSHDGVHFNSGQGMECGYGNGGTGPQSLVNRTLLVGNLVGARYGDNYSSFGTYEGTMTARDSLLLYNTHRDGWAMEWRPASNWAYQDQRFVSENTKYSRASDAARQNGTEDTGTAVWNPVADGSLLNAFMPVPNSAVGVAILHRNYSDPVSAWPGTFTVRLSTFSSQAVTVQWSVTGKANRYLPGDTPVASGSLSFLPGETVKTFAAALPGGLDLVRVALANPSNAEVTGDDAWFTNNGPLPTENVLARASGAWDYYANRVPAANAQKPPADGAGRAWTDIGYVKDATWKLDRTAPIGWGNLGAVTTPTSYLTLGTTLPSTPTNEQGITTYFRRTFNVTDPARVRSLRLELLNDDGAVAFINGVPFSPININPGTAVGGVTGILSDRLATSTKGDGAAEKVYDIPLTPPAVLSALVAGTNVLAIEVHQASNNSSDMVCDASIELILNPPGGTNFGVIEVNAASFLYWDDPSLTLFESTDLDVWQAMPGTSSPFPVEAGSGSRKFWRIDR